MVEEIVMHEIPVALVMLMGQSQIFVHVKGHDIGKAQLAGLILFDQLLIDTDRRRAGRQAEDKGSGLLVAVDLRRDVIRSPLAHFIIIFLNNNSHCFVSYLSI